MSMISFMLYAIVTVVFILLYAIDKFIDDPDKENDIANWILLAASYIFIMYADWRFAIVLLLITLSSWYFAKSQQHSIVGVIIAVMALIFFKYTNFFAKSFAALIENDFTALKIILPMGISFYTFSAISYIIDVSRGDISAKSLRDVALYLSFFPKLTSGPIQCGEDFFRQIGSKRTVGWNTFEPGIQIYVFGLFKKIVLADRLNVFVNQVYRTPNAFGSLTVFGAAVAYSLQIYFDFSGYSDMAIGIAKILGIELPRNFNAPYLSHNVTEFWKRWHITFSEWLQKYIYIRLGGNRKGRIRSYVNLIATMLIGGLWHGANWTYIVWGGLHGLSLVVHKVWMEVFKTNQKKYPLGTRIISATVTFIVVTFCWIFFRAESISQANMIIHRIICFEPGLEHPFLWLFISIIILAVASIFVLTKSKDIEHDQMHLNTSTAAAYYPLVNLSSFKGQVVFFVFCGLIICLASAGGNPFIYGKY